MSVKVLTPRVSDWLKREADSQISRAVKTVLSGGVLRCGQVCCLDTAGKVIPLAATGNETHTYTFTGTPTAGTFYLTLWHKDNYWVRTTDLTFDDAQADVDSAIETALGVSGAVTTTVTGAGAAITAIAIAFTGTGYTSRVFPLGQCYIGSITGWTACAVTRSTSAGAARNEVQTCTFGAAMTAGELAVTVFTPTGIPLPVSVAWNTDWATTMADWNTAMTAAATAWYGAASVGAVMTGTATIPVLTYSGVGFTGLAVALAQFDISGTTGPTQASIVRTTSGGTAGNRIGSQATLIAYEAVDASAGDTSGLFITNDAVVDGNELYYGGGDPTAVATALALQRIYVRNEGSYRLIPDNV